MKLPNDMWVDVSIKARQEAQKNNDLQFELFKRSVCHSFLDDIPSLKVVMGWNPLKEWIANCKPFEPKGIGKSVIMVEVIGCELSPAYKIYLAQLEADMARLRERIDEVLGIKIKKDDTSGI